MTLQDFNAGGAEEAGLEQSSLYSENMYIGFVRQQEATEQMADPHNDHQPPKDACDWDDAAWA